MLFRSMYVVAALAGAVSGANAADYGRPAVRIPYAFSWGGAYAGLAAGYGWGRVTEDGLGGVRADGGFGGAFLGYNFLAGPNTFLGVEGDIFAGDQHGTTKGVEGKLPLTGSLDGRVGFFIGDTAMYLLGGFSFAHAEVGSASSSNMGWNVGLGAEEHLAGNVFVRAEYRHSDFGKQGSISAFSNSLIGGVGVRF